MDMDQQLGGKFAMTGRMVLYRFKSGTMSVLKRFMAYSVISPYPKESRSALGRYRRLMLYELGTPAAGLLRRSEVQYASKPSV